MSDGEDVSEHVADEPVSEGGAKAPAASKKKAPSRAKAAAAAANRRVHVREPEPKVPAQEEKPAAAPREAVSVPWLTKYEFTRVLSDRATMLAYGAVPFVPLPPNFAIKTNMELREVALKELRLGVIPFKVRRTLPDGTIEEFKLRDLDIPDVYFKTARMYDVQLE